MKANFSIPCFLLVIFALFSGEISAQEKNKPEGNSYKIKGQIVEKESGKPVAYATVMLLENQDAGIWGRCR